MLLQFHLIILRTLHRYPLNRHHTNNFYLMHITFVFNSMLHTFHQMF